MVSFWDETSMGLGKDILIPACRSHVCMWLIPFLLYIWGHMHRFILKYCGDKLNSKFISCDHGIHVSIFFHKIPIKPQVSNLFLCNLFYVNRFLTFSLYVYMSSICLLLILMMLHAQFWWVLIKKIHYKCYLTFLSTMAMIERYRISWQIKTLSTYFNIQDVTKVVCYINFQSNRGDFLFIDIVNWH